jgi:hypothetical protein
MAALSVRPGQRAQLWHSRPRRRVARTPRADRGARRESGPVDWQGVSVVEVLAYGVVLLLFSGRRAAQPLGIGVQGMEVILRNSFYLQGARDVAALQCCLPALRGITQVGAASRELTGGVDCDVAVRGCTDDADKTTLRICLTTGDASTLGDVPRPAPPRRGRHAGYSVRAPTGSVCSAGAAAGAAGAEAATATSLLMSMRQPVSLAARRAF